MSLMYLIDSDISAIVYSMHLLCSAFQVVPAIPL